MTESDEQRAAAEMSEQGKADQRRGAIYIAVVVTAVVGLICGTSLLKGGGDSTDDLTDSAERICHKEVEARLKAPSTASILTTNATGGPQGPWTFSGTVDAENSFGAKIRNQWTCEIRDEGDRSMTKVRVY